MTQTKATKKALFASMLSLLLCVAMLIGSTFAWFTDSVTSGKNKIIAGNLDVDLEYTNDPVSGSWKTADGAEDLFDKDALWEPGHTEVIYVKVVNKGSLALKYQFDIGAVDKVIGYTEDNKPIDLTNFIKFGVVSVTEAYADRADARAAVEDSAVNIAKGYVASNIVLEKGQESPAMAIVVYMPETVDNSANHGKDKTVPEISLGLNVVATQATVESDSFDNMYDENAVYPVLFTDSAEGLTEALAEIPDGGKVELSDDVEMGEDDSLNIADKDVTIDLNGKTLSSPSLKESMVVDSGADVTVTGGDIVFTESHYNPDQTVHKDEPEGVPYIVVYNDKDSDEETTSLTLENCTIDFENLSSDGKDPLNGIVVDTADGKKAELNIGENAVIDCKMGSGGAIVLGTNATVNMNDGKIIANNCEDQQGVSVWGVYLDDETSVFNMKGGVIDVTGISAVSGIATWYAGTVNMSGGEINVEAYSAKRSQDAIGIESYSPSAVNMTGGTINVKKTEAGNKMTSQAIQASNKVDLTVNGTAQIIVDQSVPGNSVELGFDPDSHPGVEKDKIKYITE